MLTVLTGATGFLGSHLLAQLLRRPGQVTALVRQGGDAGWQRLERALRATGEGVPDDLRARVRLERADVAEPFLGLAPERHRELAGQADAVWHSAAVIDLVAPDSSLARVNVDGTRHVLDLVAAAPGRRPRVVLVSTAYVAGGRLDGTVREDELDDRHGFLTPYEASKHAAEQVARAWAREHRHPVTVLRPGVLVSDRALPAGASRHPLAETGARLSVLARHDPSRLVPGATPGHPLAVRIPGRADAVLNLLPVEYAARAAARLALREPAAPVETFHLTHPYDTPVRACLDVMRDVCPWLDVRIDPQAAPGPLDPAVQRLAGLMGGIHAYTFVRRRYDRSALLAALAGAVPDPVPLNTRYLRAAFEAATPSPLPATATA
ncbi:thioester reductase domain-containing protein [Streptomyces sp. yr375]|uniref:SDR family oxidoreductase n=1 Tax=Streptomyces sp. yr375 TaxID=1761906 RepID=UPI0008B24177|nr:SDR family oxidoreductase [Streptomyces sp. yr375]SEP69646.1 thioester reductase domain-containing protein [Streptomyces sp. yr375]